MHKTPSPFPRIWLKRIALALAVALLCILSLFVGYYIGYGQMEGELTREREQTRQLIDEIKMITSIDEATGLEAGKREEEIRRLKKELQTVLEEERPLRALEPQHEYAPKEPKASPPPAYTRPKVPSGSGAKLVIIIDDVSYERDVRAIRSTGLPLVMSFLPPSSRHPGSADLARGENGYMVHLPLEAEHFDDEEPSTLRQGDSEAQIAQRIAQLKQLYPNVRYMNNHTGSKYTADSEAMEKLIGVLKKEGIIFVDSRTTPKSKVPQAASKHGMRYIGRDVFLDHQSGVANVKRQIREAVEKAKRHGTAVAIGHPRPDTIRALRESKEVLGEVRLVGIDQI
ncbi:MAG: divergent polysaccharide deacetylase family protein [Campylobacterota bacterium]